MDIFRALNVNGFLSISLRINMHQLTVIILVGLLYPSYMSIVKVACPMIIPCDCAVVRFDFAALEINCHNLNISKTLKDIMASLKGKPIYRLDLSMNQLTQLNNDIFKGLHFKSIYMQPMYPPCLLLYGNPLQRFSNYAFRGVTANTLYFVLSECQLKEVPLSQLSYIENITSINLADNQIQQIPAHGFQGFKKLSVIDLRKNRLRHLYDDIFFGLEETLEEVSLPDNNLNEFPSNALKTLNNLNKINLNHNQFNSIPSNVFEEFKTENQYIILNLAANRIKYISPDAFRRNKIKLSIKTLNLQNNPITNTDFLALGCDSVLEGGGSAIVHLNACPIRCDCQFYDRVLPGFVSLSGVCASPEKYKDKNFDILAADRYVFNISQLRPGRFMGIYGSLAKKECAGMSFTKWEKSCMVPKPDNRTAGTTNVHCHRNIIIITVVVTNVVRMYLLSPGDIL